MDRGVGSGVDGLLELGDATSAVLATDAAMSSDPKGLASFDRRRMLAWNSAKHRRARTRASICPDAASSTST